MAWLKFYLCHVLLALFFSWLDSAKEPRPPHCRGYVMTLRCELHGVALHVSSQQFY
jgi:hypothetical protein